MRITFAVVLVAVVVAIVASPGRATPKPTTSVDVASVARGLDPVPEWPVVSATKDGVMIEGKAIVAIKNGDVDPAEKEGGAMGMKIPRITTFTKALLAATKSPPAGMLVILDQTTPYRLMMQLLFSIKSAGIKQFDFVAKDTRGALGVIPLTLPDKAAASTGTVVTAGAPPPKDAPLTLVVAMTKDKLIVWSISGIEGTLQKPKATLKPGELDKLTQAVADIKKRHATEKTVLVMCDGAMPMKSVLELMTAVRTGTDGKALFPDVQLSSGFE